MPQVAPVIGITGKAGAGKDTVAEFLVASRGGYRYAFADPIKAMLRGIGLDLNDPYWQDRDRKGAVIPAIGASPRRLMQTLGTEWGRGMINEDLWLILALQRLHHGGPGMIISDVRYENEADWVRKRGGFLIHVQRDNLPKTEAHSSENGVSIEADDVIIINNGDLAELQAQVRENLNGR